MGGSDPLYGQPHTQYIQQPSGSGSGDIPPDVTFVNESYVNFNSTGHKELPTVRTVSYVL